jgi:hypothetical protein
MNVQHVNIKFYVQNPGEVELEKYSGIFNQWIQRHVMEELLVDVADYLHVCDGPGVILIGHEANYSLDNTAGRLGLLYNRKAQLEGTTADKLIQAARAALNAAHLLEKENGVNFNGREAQIILNDRLIAPNTAETLSALEPDLKIFFDKLYNGAKYTLTRGSTDPRERFTADVNSSSDFDVETLLENLSAETEPAHV